MQLDHYRLLGHSGLRVSPLCLGTMTFGEGWGWGSDKEESRRVFDAYVDKGGNFVDTANFYTNGTSEEYVGEFISEKRSRIVLATKYTLNTAQGDPNAGGNHRKNMIHSVEASLKRLNTDIIDLLWVHAWEGRTPIEEMMRALDDLVRAGKIMYVGISDVPAWIAAVANTTADFRGWTPFIALQVQHSLIERSVERDLVPMAQTMGMGCTPWGPLAGGLLTGKHTRDEIKENQDGKRPINEKRLNERNRAIVDCVVEIAGELGKSPAQVAIRWLMDQPGITSPILGARTETQLLDNLGCLDVTLSDEQNAKLNTVSEIDMGFPHTFLSGEFVVNMISGNTQIESRHPISLR